LSEFVLPVINTPYVLEYLFHSNIDFDSQTLFSEIKQLEPGTTLSFNVSTGAIKFKSYIQPVSYSSEHSIANLKSNLFNSVKLRLISDIGIGFLLSGGLDSNSLVSITKNIEHHGINTNYNLFSVVFPGYSSSEDQEINLALKSYPSFQSHSFSYDANTLLTRLREVIRAQELPFRSISTVSQYLLYEYISTNSDSKVIISGQGADEIFAGYHEHFFAYLLELLIKLKFFKFIQEFTQIKKILQTSSLKYMKLILVNWISLILKRYFFSKSKFISKKYNIKMSDFLLFSLKYNIHFSALKEYLRYEDKNSMAFSLESRVPFLDTIIVEQVLSIDSHKKINLGKRKWILREILKDLIPPSVYSDYTKKGFIGPQSEWQNTTEFGHFIRQISSKIKFNNRRDRIKDRLYSSRIDYKFRKAMVYIWLEEFIPKNGDGKLHTNGEYIL
jgi:asparagine synthase (glutamine-hydrolysing)